MYSRDNVSLENRHSLENVYNVFSENTPLKKFTYPIFLDGRGKARGGQQPCSRPGAAGGGQGTAGGRLGTAGDGWGLGWGTARGRLGAAIIGRFAFDFPARPQF